MVQDFVRQHRKLVALGTVLILAYLAFWFVNNFIFFRLVSITPNPKKDIATSTSRIEIKFTKALDSSINYKDRLSDNHDVVRSIEVSGKSIYLNLTTLSKDLSYDLKLTNITAKNKQVYPEVHINFNPKYVPYSKLTEKEKSLQLKETDNGNMEDPFKGFLPYGGLNFRLTGSYETLEDQSTFVITAEVLLSNADVSIDRDAAIDQAKNDISEYITSTGHNPDDYLIRYIVVDP